MKMGKRRKEERKLRFGFLRMGRRWSYPRIASYTIDLEERKRENSIFYERRRRNARRIRNQLIWDAIRSSRCFHEKQRWKRMIGLIRRLQFTRRQSTARRLDELERRRIGRGRMRWTSRMETSLFQERSKQFRRRIGRMRRRNALFSMFLHPTRTSLLNDQVSIHLVDPWTASTRTVRFMKRIELERRYRRRRIKKSRI